MRIAVIYGLGATSGGNGNGLKVLADWYTSKGHDVTVHGAWDKIELRPFDLIVTHSLGYAEAMEYAKFFSSWRFELICIEAIPDYTRWLNMVGSEGTHLSIPSNISKCTNYHCGGYSWPHGCIIDGATNIAVPNTGHSSIVPVAVVDIQAVYNNAT